MIEIGWFFMCNVGRVCLDGASTCEFVLGQGVKPSLMMAITGGNMGRKIFWGLLTQGER